MNSATALAGCCFPRTSFGYGEFPVIRLPLRRRFEGSSSGESGRGFKLPLDPQQLVELGDSFTPTARTRLEMSGSYRHGQVGNRGVLRFS